MMKETWGIPRALPLRALSIVAASAMIFAAGRALRNEGSAPAAAFAQVQSGQPSPGAQSPEPAVSAPSSDLPESMRVEQKRNLRKYRFKKMKDHAAELATLAKSLQEDLDKSNENVLSLHVIDKAQKIEKLAKTIRDEARFGT